MELAIIIAGLAVLGFSMAFIPEMNRWASRPREDGSHSFAQHTVKIIVYVLTVLLFIGIIGRIIKPFL